MFEKKAEGFFILSKKGLEKLKQKQDEQNLLKEIKSLNKRLKDIENRLSAGGL